MQLIDYTAYLILHGMMDACFMTFKHFDTAKMILVFVL